MFKKTIVVLTLTLLALSVLPGCGRGVKEGLYAVTGASGKVQVISGNKDAINDLANQYGNVTIESFGNSAHPDVPYQFFTKLQDKLAEEPKYRKDPSGDDPGVPFFTGPAHRTIVIRGDLIHYESAELMDMATGPLEQAICRVRLYDAASNQPLGEANCSGQAKSSVRKGPEELAHGVAKAVRKLLKPK